MNQFVNRPSRLGLQITAIVSLQRGMTLPTSILKMILNNHDKARGMQRKPSFQLFPGPLRPRVVEPDRILSMGQIKPFDI